MSKLRLLFCALVLASLVACATSDAHGRHARALRASSASGREVGAGGTYCDKYSSPHGSDRTGNGSWQKPFRSVTRLDHSLAGGGTGCLMGGTYGSVSTWHNVSASGSYSHYIAITSYPGQTATVVGWIQLSGSYTILSHLEIDGSNTQYKSVPSGASCPHPVSDGLSIEGPNDILEYDDYYESVASLRGQGIGIGWEGNADNTIIRYDKIHDVGSCEFYDHLIYLSAGNGVEIYDNWLWDDPHGWGIKLDPGPTNARIWNNVIDGAGSGFNFGNSSGSQPTAGNQVWNNIVMNSVGINAPQLNWAHRGVMVTSPGLAGNSTGNSVYGNDSYGNKGGTKDISHDVSSSQLSVSGNVSVNPHLADPPAHNFAPTSATPSPYQSLWNGQS